MSASEGRRLPLRVRHVVPRAEGSRELKPGETLLVLGAAGGVGLAAVELGEAMGATVIAAASSEVKLAVPEHGAALTINYELED